MVLFVFVLCAIFSDFFSSMLDGWTKAEIFEKMIEEVNYEVGLLFRWILNKTLAPGKAFIIKQGKRSGKRDY